MSSAINCSLARLICATSSAICGCPTSASSSCTISLYPRMLLSGVRSSWLTWRRNSVLLRLAASAACRAASSAPFSATRSASDRRRAPSYTHASWALVSVIAAHITVNTLVSEAISACPGGGSVSPSPTVATAITIALTSPTLRPRKNAVISGTSGNPSTAGTGNAPSKRQ